MVFKSAERRNNTAHRLVAHLPSILTLVWLTTIDEVKADPLGPIWIRPLDYREATKGSRFSTDRQPTSWGYRRDVEREFHVDRRVKKLRLLGNEVR